MLFLSRKIAMWLLLPLWAWLLRAEMTVNSTRIMLPLAQAYHCNHRRRRRPDAPFSALSHARLPSVPPSARCRPQVHIFQEATMTYDAVRAFVVPWIQRARARRLDEEASIPRDHCAYYPGPDNNNTFKVQHCTADFFCLKFPKETESWEI